MAVHEWYQPAGADVTNDYDHPRGAPVAARGGKKKGHNEAQVGGPGALRSRRGQSRGKGCPQDRDRVATAGNQGHEADQQQRPVGRG